MDCKTATTWEFCREAVPQVRNTFQRREWAYRGSLWYLTVGSGGDRRRVSEVRNGEDGLRKEHRVEGMNGSLGVPASQWGPMWPGGKVSEIRQGVVMLWMWGTKVWRGLQGHMQFCLFLEIFSSCIEDGVGTVMFLKHKETWPFKMGIYSCGNGSWEWLSDLSRILGHQVTGLK